ncbi:hypothetical protein HK102_010877 [Quaeritorhiza haematococci]|nr:hypothetical protein HK102_010877 [Quaeritorhiza haematococci]
MPLSARIFIVAMGVLDLFLSWFAEAYGAPVMARLIGRAALHHEGRKAVGGGGSAMASRRGSKEIVDDLERESLLEGEEEAGVREEDVEAQWVGKGGGRGAMSRAELAEIVRWMRKGKIYKAVLAEMKD